jgi:hypothetical protein
MVLEIKEKTVNKLNSKNETGSEEKQA